MTKQQQGASSGEDRATHEQSPQAVSAVPVGIPSAFVRYPTGDELDELTEFCAARMPAIYKPDMSRSASLAEVWWLETMEGRKCPLKQGWSFVYRFARDRAVERCVCSDGAADLLAHQLTELTPTLFAAARSILAAQAIEARRAETQGGSVHESAVGETDASDILNDICNQSAEALKPLGESE